MIWLSFCSNKIFDYQLINGRLNGEKYLDLLKNAYINLENHFENKKFYFIQDNAPPHRPSKISNFLESKNIIKLKWPGNSPDLNPIENLFGIITRQVYSSGKIYFNKHDLLEAIEKAINSV